MTRQRDQNVEANRVPANPYALFRLCCTNLATKDYAQLCGVVSFSLFLCLVVISLMLFGALSIFYIVTGVIVYSLLMKCLFGLAEKMYVLFYLLFEAVQIGFHMALLLYVALPLLFFTLPSQQCQTVSYRENGTFIVREMCKPSTVAEEYTELLLFILILVSVKLYFARVFAHFYKYLVWNEKLAQHVAQYVDSRGVQISALGHFPPPPPSFWDNPVVTANGYGYDQQQQQQQIINGAAEQPKLAELPSYAQAIGHQQQKAMSQPSTNNASPDISTTETMPNKNSVELNLHV